MIALFICDLIHFPGILVNCDYVNNSVEYSNTNINLTK